MHTIVRSDRRGRLSAGIRPWPSSSTMVARVLPNPASPSAFHPHAITSAPTPTPIGRAPNIPPTLRPPPIRPDRAGRPPQKVRNDRRVRPKGLRKEPLFVQRFLAHTLAHRLQPV